ncbi:MAG: hypothetical protein HYZ43_05790 [Flavobacteriia bacterium]|nr:hypothetical protein [Flavobacteriia bacterium]
MQDETQKINTLSTLLVLIYSGLLFGQLSFAGVTFLALKPAVVANEDPLFLYMTIALIVAGIAGGLVFWNRMKAQIQSTDNLNVKLQKYRTTTIIRMALLEGPNLFGVVAYLQTGNKIIMGLAAFGMLVFACYLPMKKVINRDLGYSNSI